MSSLFIEDGREHARRAGISGRMDFLVSYTTRLGEFVEGSFDFSWDTPMRKRTSNFSGESEGL